MATNLERLVVSLDADITRLTRQLSEAGISLDDFSKTADAKAGAAKNAINKHLGPGSGGINTMQFQELAASARHGFDALISGANPLRVLAIEGTKASAAMGPGGLAGFSKQLGTSLASVLSPARLVTGGVIGIGAAALYSYDKFEEAQRQIRTGLIGVGAASHATVADINQIGQQVAKTSNIPVSAARQIATSIAATGKVDVSQIGDIAGLAKGYGVLTGQSAGDAGSALAKIFADPAKGAETLNERLGTLDGSTLEYIRHLTESGDVMKAQQVLFNATSSVIQQAAKETGIWASAWDAVSSKASQAANDVGAAVAAQTSPNLQRQLALLKAEREALANQGSANLDAQVGAGQVSPNAGGALAGMRQQVDQLRASGSGADLAAMDKKIADLQAEINTTEKLVKDNADRTKAADQSRMAGPAVARADPANAQIEQQKADVANLEKSVAAAQHFGTLPAGVDNHYERLTADLESARQKLKEMQADEEKGGRFTAQALRDADFQKSTAGLSAYAKGLAEINHEYDRLIANARKDPNTKSVETYTQAQAEHVAAYNQQYLDSRPPT